LVRIPDSSWTLRATVRLLKGDKPLRARKATPAEIATPFDLLLTRYVLERFLYRLGSSRHRERFILKGAVLLATWFDDPRGQRVISTGDLHKRKEQREIVFAFLDLEPHNRRRRFRGMPVHSLKNG
jgi:hypothetical protein